MLKTLRRLLYNLQQFTHSLNWHTIIAFVSKYDKEVIVQCDTKKFCEKVIKEYFKY